MFVTGILVLVASVIWFLKTLLSWWWDMLRLPPGPTPIPLYGNQTPPDVHPGLVAWYSELREKYGNVFTVYQGTKPTVVVNGYRAITELLIENGNLVHSRPTRDQNVLNFLHNSAGLVWNNNSYRLLRKISSQAIKSFISAYNNTDRSFSNKYDQIDNVLEHLKLSEKEEKGVDLCSPLRGMVSHHICSMLFGLENQEKFPDIMALHCESLGCVINIDSIMHLPLLKYLPKFRDTWAQSISTKQQFYDFLKLQLEEHRRCSEERLCDNFFDMFLRYSHSNGGKAQSLSETDCHATVMQLLLAGLDAVHGTLMWLLLYVSMHEDVQEKLDREIYNQIGYDSKPTVRHMSSTPYCIAVINETLRMSNVAFTSLPYINQQKVVIDGKTIPANTSILVNLVSVNKDPETFENPNKFHPERFMEKNGDLKNVKQFSPFSLGRRACLGESFSKSSIYIVLVSILQKYRLCKIEGVEYSTESVRAFLSTPAPYNLRYVPRCKNTDIHT